MPLTAPAGNGDVTGALEPSLLSHIYGAPIARIACGEAHSVALTTSGCIWTWGSNSFGQVRRFRLCLCLPELFCSWAAKAATATGPRQRCHRLVPLSTWLLVATITLRSQR